MCGFVFFYYGVLASSVCSRVFSTFSIGEQRVGLCASCAFCLFILHVLILSLFSSQGLAAACDCGTPWTFLLTFLLADASDI